MLFNRNSARLTGLPLYDIDLLEKTVLGDLGYRLYIHEAEYDEMLAFVHDRQYGNLSRATATIISAAPDVCVRGDEWSWRGIFPK